jgi:PAS domain S-box-containing protein
VSAPPAASEGSAPDGADFASAQLGSTGIGTSVRDLLTGERHWDSAMKSIFGLAPESPTPTHEKYLQLVVAEDRERVDAEQQRLATDGQYLELDYRIRTPAGELRHIFSRSAVQYDETGRPLRVLSASIDQTASRRAAAQLNEAHERLRLATETSGIGSWERLTDSGVGRWDTALFHLFGLPPAEAAPSRAAMLQRIHPDDRAGVETAWQAIVGSDRTVEYAYRIPQADGSMRHVISRGRALKTVEEQPRRAIGTTIDVTAARRAEREHADLLARLQLVTATAGVGVWERKLATGAELWDARMREVHGVDDAFEPDRERWLKLVIPEQRATVAAIEAGWVEGLSGAHECRIVLSDSRQRNVARNAVLIRGEAGTPDRLLGTAIDVTDVRRAQRERDELYERMQMVADAVGLGVWDWDLLAEASVWSDQMYALFGRTREQFRSLVWLDVVHPDDVPMAKAALQAALASGASFDLEYRALWPDGTVHWLASRGRIERDAVGNAVRMIGVTWDITGRRETEARLRDVVQRLSLTTASTGIGLWTVDLRNGQVEWDEQMRRLYGAVDEASTNLAHAWMEMTHPDERQTVLAAAMNAVQRGEPLDIDVRIVRRDGEVCTIAHRAQIERDAAGTPLRQLGVCWDITERRHAEQVLREKEAAERASKAKSEFLSRVSHELRTPLNAILGFAQILEIDRSTPLAAIQKERLQHIMAAGKHLLSLINDVLDLSRIEAGADKLNMRPTDVLSVVDACLALVAEQASAQGIVVRAPPVATALPSAWVDATRLQQVLLNLLSNAIKYNRAGGSVDISVGEAQAGYLALRVTDTGTGMNAAQVAQLFQPFNRLGRETQPISGAGIGLTITQRLIEQMGGTLTVVSQPDIGSEFTVLLRAAAGAGAASSSSSSAAEAAVSVAPRTDVHGRVLYVEDIASNRALVEALLTMRPGVTLLIAENGTQALRLAAQQPPDVALIDIGLPDMTGTEVLRRLRTLPHLRDLPCVAVSANALTQEIEQAIAAGFNDYWTKPLQAARFLRGLDNLLVGRGADGTA